jgi:GH35 family endo-1,4-beta-xylanase
VEKWRPLIRRRLEQIAERYDGRIHTWDGVNEVLNRRKHTPMPRDYVRWVYDQADDLLRSGRLFVNEAQPVWREFVWEDSHYYMMIRMLRELGCRIDGIGIQHHAWGANHDALPRFLGGMFDPAHELDVLDQFADFGLPVHISEITIPAAGRVAEGERIQARIVEDLYRLWFSHPAMESIIYWNIADGHGHKDQAEFQPGLLREGLSPKPSWQALERLINEEWRTRTTLTTDADGRAGFRGYKGLYRATVDGREHLFTVSEEPVEQMLAGS